MSLIKSRLDWVDVAKGISILLVVMMHSAYGIGEETGNTGVLHYVIAWATPFRMPEFFLISGLFLSLVIARDWTHYADRRVVHYLYFYLVWAALHIAFKFAFGAYTAEASIGYLAEGLYKPYGILWFIYMLAVFSGVAKLLYELRLPHWAILAATAALQIAPVETHIYVVDKFAEYFVYFYAGYAGAPVIFRIVDWARRHIALAVAGLIAWLVVHSALVLSPGFEVLPMSAHLGIAGLPGVLLLLAVAGSIALCVLAMLLARFPAMDWLRWLGTKSIVVYLAFAVPMGVLREVFMRTGLIENTSIMSLLVMAFALISPLILYWVIQVTGWGRFLFERPAWAHLPGAPGSRWSPREPVHRQPAE
jgi:uncharacterized membrane protein YcfT